MALSASASQPHAVAAPVAEPLLRVVDLHTHIALSSGIVKAVNGVSFTVGRGESVGIVGESGSGKTMTCLSIMQLMSVATARIASGEIWYEGEDLLKKSQREMQAYRGRRIAMIMQDALAALNPVLRIGDQVGEPVRYHHLETSMARIRQRVVEVLSAVRIPRPEERLNDYPHQFSGGMRQRIVAAMGLSTSPGLIIADEPTTALDVTIQAQFLLLVRELQRKTGMAVLWITHDLGVVAQTCDRVNVMYGGRIVESGPVRRIFSQPRHPYTVGLLESVPRLGEKRRRLHQIDGQPLSLMRLPKGCPFYDRCPIRMDVCRDSYPEKTPVGEDGYVHCWARTSTTAASPAR